MTVVNAMLRILPLRSAAATIARASTGSSAIGFSHRTCNPASRAAIDAGAWNLFGVQMTTASSFSRSNMSR
jgi:hypothetical protein